MGKQWGFVYRLFLVLLVSFLFASICYSDITTGLQVYCPMDEAAGYIVENKVGTGDAIVRRVDWSGTWQDDPILASPAWEPSGGKFYGCLNGHSSANGGQPIWCELIDAVAVGYSTPETTTAYWIKMETGDTPYVVNAEGAWGGRALFNEFNNDDYFYAQAVSGGVSERWGPWKSTMYGDWHHVAFVTDITNPVEEDRLKIYIDGSHVGAGTSFPGTTWPIDLDVMSFCGSPSDWGANSECRIDEFRFYHRALSSSDITELVNHVPSAPGPGRAVINGPVDEGWGSDEWRLSWMDGTGGPFDSYDVYLGRDYDAVNSATTAEQCTPGSSNLVGDVDNDCAVDAYDLAELAVCWLSAASCNEDADLYDSATIDFSDYAVLSSNWDVSKPFVVNTANQEYWLPDLKEGQEYYWRIDAVKGAATVGGAVWSFDAIDPWQQTTFVNMMGWTETMQLATSYRSTYAQSLADLGIRNTMDSEQAMQYTYPKGLQTFIYKNPTGPEYPLNYMFEPAVCGYFQFDEPSSSTFSTTVKEYHWACRDIDPNHPSYTNVLSSHGTGTGSFSSYLDSFLNAVEPEMLSFDCYPYRYGFDHHYWSLHTARLKALARDIPLWNWQQTVQKHKTLFGSADPPSNEVNRNRLRNVCYSSLAYGVKGISWFDITLVYTFGTQSYGNRTWSTTSWWSDLAEVNNEINRVGEAMVGLTSQEVYHTNSVSGISIPLLSSYPGFWIQIADSHSGFVLGTFQDEQGTDYAMIHNKDDSTTVSNKQIDFQVSVSSVELFDETSGTWNTLPVYGSYPNQYVLVTMGPGYGKLLRIE